MARKIRVENSIRMELENRLVMEEVKWYYKLQYLRGLLVVAALLVAAFLYYVLN